MTNEKLADSRGCVEFSSTEVVVITIPITGWYKIVPTDKEIFLEAGTQLVKNGFQYSKDNGVMRSQI